MVTMNVSLPDSLKRFVDEQVSERGFGTTSEYVRALIRYDRDRSLLRERILASADAEFSETLDEAYFERLRGVIRATGNTATAR
jgi:antitoxin ParD1/3/4